MCPPASNRYRNCGGTGRRGAALGIALVLSSLPAAPTVAAPTGIETAFDAIDRNDLAAAAAVLEPLAAGGDPRAQAALSLVLDSAQAGISSTKPALEWLEQAAEQGLAGAALELGNRCYRGDGLAQDPQAAVAWWRTAADAGLAQAQHNLGIAYALGIGVDSSPEDAAGWLRLAANGGSAPASFALAVLHANGDLGERDYRMARTLLERAARSGHAPAQYHLGVVYELGLGGPRDPVQSRRWLMAAARRDAGDAPAAAGQARQSAPQEPARAGTAAQPRIFGAAWARQQDPDHYTLQIAAGLDGGALRDTLTRYVPDRDSAYFKFRGSENEPYIAIVGSFATIGEANAALKTLPAPLQSNSPWVRRFGGLQERFEDAPPR